MGFISLLLAISRAPISRICVTEAVTNSFLPCNNPEDFDEIIVSTGNRIPSLESDPTISDEGQVSYCEARGKVSLISREGVMQLNIFISVLAMFHILYCILTMCLGLVKMQRWKAWEEETRTLEYQIANDPMRFRLTRQTSFGQRHLKLWSNHFLLLWPVCFIRQFNGSASRADYFTLRHAFIMANVAEGSSFNFQKFLGRAFDHDFKQVVEISNKNSSVVRGSFVVKPNDEYFWFSRPKWLLHLLQLVMIQNSFQLAFFAWAWVSLQLQLQLQFLQLLCGYSTLPLYALVTQVRIHRLRMSRMGSGMNSAIFTERVAKGLKFWHHKAKLSLSRQKSVSTIASESGESRVSAVTHRCNEVEEDDPTPEISEKPKAKIKTKGSYVGEISFGNSWRHGHGHGIVIGEIIEEGNKH
ncbi:hypothetical protein V6N11_038266 [Hibiscus sabdariffa]|uniref:MLO-like protein n=1 Tax=Hibiscus sabdariffa TaxID=183260 RepID=A0ABR2SJS5_9ROSI